MVEWQELKMAWHDLAFINPFMMDNEIGLELKVVQLINPSSPNSNSIFLPAILGQMDREKSLFSVTLKIICKTKLFCSEKGGNV